MLPAPLGPCNGVTYVSERFYETLNTLQTKAIGASGTDPRQLALMAEVQKMFRQGPVLGVTIALPDGFKSTTVSPTSGRVLMASLTAAPVGLMAAVAIPSFVNARQRAQGNACINNLRQISGAKDQYALDHNGKAPASLPDLSPTYITRLPVCPAGGTYRLGGLEEDPACSRGRMGGHTI